MSSTSCSRQEPPARSWPRAASSRQRSSSCRGIPTERSATHARGPSRAGASSSSAQRRFGVCVRVGDGICKPGRLGVQVRVGVRTRRAKWSVRSSRIADDLHRPATHAMTERRHRCRFVASRVAPGAVRLEAGSVRRLSSARGRRTALRVRWRTPRRMESATFGNARGFRTLAARHRCLGRSRTSEAGAWMP
jgi:hypothetical protein